MKTAIVSLLAAGLVAGAALAAPAMAQTPQTELTKVDGKKVDTLLLRYAFDASWVVDQQHILVRDTYLDHYVIAMSEPCRWLDGSTYKNFVFFPALSGQIRSGRAYEVRNDGFKPCTISSITQVPSNQAAELKSKVAQKG